MIEVIDNIEMPQSARLRYPHLEVGQGFVLPPMPAVRRRNIQAYLCKVYGQGKIMTRTIEDGGLFIKRIA